MSIDFQTKVDFQTKAGPRDNITCPQCRRSGSVAWNTTPASKHEHAGNHGRSEIQELSEGFAALDSNGRDNLQIICQICRTTVERALVEHEIKKESV